MKIALITANYPPAAVPCGIGDYTRCLRAAFDAQGHATLVLTSRRSQASEPATFPLADRWGWTDLRQVRRLVQTERPDVILLQYTPEHYGFGLAFKLLPLSVRWARSAPLVVTTFHTLVGGRWIAKPYAALLAAGSQGLISTHAELTHLFCRHLPWWKGRLCEIPIGANIPPPKRDRADARQVLRQRLGLAPQEAVVGTFGFPAPGKGLETLIQALSHLPEPPTTHVVCIGETRTEDRPYRAGLDALAQRLRVDDRLHWMGGLPDQDVTDTIAGTDAYVVPYDEGASLRRGTLMAGFRAGVPIITTTPRYADPSLRPGETILAVPPRSPKALADCIRALLDDTDGQERLRCGTGIAAARFEWATIAAQHLEFFQRLRRRREMSA